MIYKLLAPMHSPFALEPGRNLNEPVKYSEFWDLASERKSELAEHVSLEQMGLGVNLERLHFLHTSSGWQSPYNRYRTLQSNSLERSIELMQMTLERPPLVGELAKQAGDTLEAMLLDRVHWITCRVYDNNIALMEIDIDLGDWISRMKVGEVPEQLDNLQDAGVKIAAELARRFGEELLFPLTRWLDDIGRDRKSVPDTRLSNRTLSTNRFGELLWTTRTLIFQRGDGKNRAAAIRHWLKDSGVTKEGELTPLHDSGAHMTRWLNYLYRENAYPEEGLFRTDTDGRRLPFCDTWESMLIAQYYYSALDVLDQHLTFILAKALDSDAKIRMVDLQSILERTIQKANLLMLRIHDDGKYLKRTVKDELDEILDFWNFETVVVDPVREKTQLCQERLTLLHEQSASKSALYTDLILLGIGIFAIFEFFLNIVVYGRSMVTDVDLATYDVNSVNVVHWLSEQPTDVTLVLSAGLSVLVLAFYFYFRRRQSV
jgi:hypothetical protein